MSVKRFRSLLSRLKQTHAHFLKKACVFLVLLVLFVAAICFFGEAVGTRTIVEKCIELVFGAIGEEVLDD